MWGDLYLYLFVLFDKQQALAGIAVPSVIAAWALALLERFRRLAGHRANAWIRNGRWSIALLAVFFIGFSAWRDEHEARLVSEQKISDLSGKVSEYSIGAHGEVVHPLVPASDNAYLHLVIANTTQGTLEIFPSTAKIIYPNKEPFDVGLNGTRIRPNTPMTYRWEVGKLTELNKEGEVKLSVTINYGLPGKKPARRLHKEIVVTYKVTGVLVTSESRDDRDEDAIIVENQ